MPSRSARVLANFAFTTVLATEFIFRGVGTRSSFCSLAGTKAHRRRTSGWRSSLRSYGVNEMVEKLTIYDPAEDLLSDDGIATFMEEAFKTEDASYIAHALGVV